MGSGAGGGNLGGGQRPGAGFNGPGGLNSGLGREGGLGGADFGRAGGMAGRPSAGQLNDFLNIPHPSDLGSGNAKGGMAAADFLRGGTSGAAAPRPAAGDVFGGAGARPGVENRPAVADRPGVENRPAVADRPGLQNRPAVENRPGLENRPAVANRPDRIENRQQWMDNRGERWGEVRNQVRDNYPRLDFWADHPGWASWRINAPYRWAAWGALSGWLGYGAAATAYPYSYGDTIYYQDNSVYSSDGQVIASADDYAQQAQQIATSAPPTAPDQSDWMPLGVFAMTQDGEASGATPTRFMQLAVSKQGVIRGLLNNKLTDETQDLEGMIDKDSQRAAWTVKGQTRPIIETGLQNLTTDTGSALIHYADGKTQQVLLVRLPDPEAKQ